MSSRIVTTSGFVLRSLRYGDTSRVATLFTRDLGKISIIAKGARVPGSLFGASLDLFTLSQFVVYYRPGRNLQMLKSGDVDHHFAHIADQPRRFVFGCAVLEYLDRMILEDEPAPELFGLGLRVLTRVDRSSLSAVSEVVRAFQLRTAALLGYALQLDACLHCGASLAEAALLDEPSRETGGRASWLFRPAEGGAVCVSCAAAAGTGYSVTPRALLRIRAMVVGAAADRVSEAGPSYRAGGAERAAVEPSETGVRDRWQRTLEALVEDYLRFHVERYRGLRSLGTADEAPRKSVR
ncbi:MAG: DNA repair protein RecO [Candidatus Eisenbacteria bacterium]|uniref:DNA repair protein RecO n=1 Tax=Eiseniibacteriota bacterium TaxID=2212470 RepID=A0A956RP99_UNCEI|nr:DNA repair protein RecO [Candidatus Eisenbacteria bacterium]